MRVELVLGITNDNGTRSRAVACARTCHLSISCTTYSFAFLGTTPREFPHRYIDAVRLASSPLGMWKLFLHSLSSSCEYQVNDGI